MKNVSPAEIAAKIFENNPKAERVFVVGEYGFISQNAAKLHAAGKRISEVLREGKTPKPLFTGDFDGMVKKQLLEQADLRGMTLDTKMTNNAIIEALKTYDGSLGREIEEQDPTTIEVMVEAEEDQDSEEEEVNTEEDQDSEEEGVNTEKNQEQTETQN